MQFIDPRIARIALGMKETQTQGEIDSYGRLRLVRVRQKKGMSRWGCQLLRQLGQRLVVWGQRLQRYGLPQPSL